MNIFDKYREEHTFKTKREELEFKLACVDWVARAEYFFRDPTDLDKPLRLYGGQKRAGYCLQYGIDPLHREWGVKKGILLTAGRQLVGKSTVTAAMAASGLIDPLLRFGLFAHVEDKSFELMNKLAFFLMNSPFRYMVKQKSKQKITLSNNSFAQTHAASSSIEGGAFHYALIDEAGWMEDRVVQMHILPTTRKIGKRWMMLGTPKGMRGVFYLLHERAKRDIQAGAPPKYHMIYMDPVKDGVITAEALAEEVKSGEAGIWARQELLGEFISAEDLYFGEGMIEYAMGNVTIENARHKGTPYPNSWSNMRHGAQYSLGMDFGLTHANTVFCLARQQGELIYIDFMKAFVGATAYLPILATLSSEYLPYWKPRWIVPDGTGIGRTNCELIREMVKFHRYCQIVDSDPNARKKHQIGFIMGDNKIKQEMFQNLHNLFAKKGIVLPSHMGAVYENQPGYDMYELKRELCNLQYSQQPKYVKFESTSESIYTDRIIALALAVYPFRTDPSKTKYKTPFLMDYIRGSREPYVYSGRQAYLERFDQYGRGNMYG